MKKQVLTGVVLTIGLLVSCLRADVCAGQGIKEIYRKLAKGKIETNNNSIKDVLNWAHCEEANCVKKFLTALALKNEELKKSLRTDPATDDSSRLKTVGHTKKIIKKHNEKLLKEFLICLKKINEEKIKLILQCKEDSEEVIKNLEKKLGNQAVQPEKPVVSEQKEKKEVTAAYK